MLLLFIPIGIMVDASVTGANYEKIPFHGYSGWSVRYEYTVNSEKYHGSSVGIESADVKGGNIKGGDTLKVFYLPHNPSISVPFLPSKYKLFSLRNKRI